MGSSLAQEDERWLTSRCIWMTAGETRAVAGDREALRQHANDRTSGKTAMVSVATHHRAASAGLRVSRAVVRCSPSSSSGRVADVVHPRTLCAGRLLEQSDLARVL